MSEEWIAVIGSPRRGMNTEKLVDIVSEALSKRNINVRKFHLDNSVMYPCTNCEYCISHGKCHINDEVSEIISEMKDANGIILASLSYNYNVTSQMKVFLDRCFSLNDFSGGEWKSRLGSEKKALIVSLCKGNKKESLGFTTEAMKKVISDLDVEVIGTIECLDTKYNPIDVKADKVNEIKNQVFTMIMP